MSRIPRNHKGELFGGELARGSFLIPTEYWETKLRAYKAEHLKTAPSLETVGTLFLILCNCTKRASWPRLGGQWAVLVAESNNQLARAARYDTREAREKAARTVGGQIAHTRISNCLRFLEHLGLLPLQKRGGGRDKMPSIRQVLFPAPDEVAQFLTERELSRYVQFLGDELGGSDNELGGSDNELGGKHGQHNGAVPATPRFTSTVTTTNREQKRTRENDDNWHSIAD